MMMMSSDDEARLATVTHSVAQHSAARTLAKVPTVTYALNPKPETRNLKPQPRDPNPSDAPSLSTEPEPQTPKHETRNRKP